MPMPAGFKHRPETRAKMSAAALGKNNPNWNGGRKTYRGGYVYLKSPNHPFATASGYVAEHRLVMEAHLGRTLLPTEVVHHINGDTADNRIENLMLFSDGVKHTRFHAAVKGAK